MDFSSTGCWNRSGFCFLNNPLFKPGSPRHLPAVDHNLVQVAMSLQILMKQPQPVQAQRGRGFTLIELLVVIAIIAILAGMLLPALSKAKTKAQGIQCMASGRQMMLAWKLYIDDNNDRVPKSYGANQWVNGNLDYSANPSNWDINQDLAKSVLWNYCGKSPGIWKCPADLSKVTVRGAQVARVRSISMNAWFDSEDVSGFGPPKTKIYKRMGDLTDPGPSMTWVFLDEREDSINDGEMVVGMFGYPDKPQSWTIVDFPASYHNGAGGLSFADGHSEIRRWVDSRTMPKLKRGQGLPLNVPSRDNRDVIWLMERSTRID